MNLGSIRCDVRIDTDVDIHSKLEKKIAQGKRGAIAVIAAGAMAYWEFRKMAKDLKKIRYEFSEEYDDYV